MVARLPAMVARPPAKAEPANEESKSEAGAGQLARASIGPGTPGRGSDRRSSRRDDDMFELGARGGRRASTSQTVPSKEEATEKMLQLILTDRHESSLFESFLHHQYRVELYFFLRACETFEAFTAKCIALTPAAPDGTGGGVMGTSANPSALKKAREIYERYLTPAGDYCVRPHPAHANVVAARLRHGAVPVTLFQVPKAAVVRTLASEFLEPFAEWIATDGAAEAEAGQSESSGGYGDARRGSDQTDATASDEVYVIDRFGNRVRTRDSGFMDLDRHSSQRHSSAFRESFKDFRDSFLSNSSTLCYDPEIDEPEGPARTLPYQNSRSSWVDKRSLSREAQPGDVSIHRTSSFRNDSLVDAHPNLNRSASGLVDLGSSPSLTSDGDANSRLSISAGSSGTRDSLYSYESSHRDSMYESCYTNGDDDEADDPNAPDAPGRAGSPTRRGSSCSDLSEDDEGPDGGDPPHFPASPPRPARLEPIGVPKPRRLSNARRFSDAKPNLQVFQEANEEGNPSGTPSPAVHAREIKELHRN